MTIEKAFWDWFVANEEEFFSFDPCNEAKREALFDRLATELQKANPHLTFEFGPNNAKREFVISAAGIRKAFPSVVALAQAAPILDRWVVTAFRPRRNPIYPVEINGKCVDPKQVEFSLLNNGQLAGVHLYIPGFLEEDIDLKQIGYILLDETLGEYDVETKLGLIKFLPVDAEKVYERHPLSELPKLFDALASGLERRSGRPS